MSNSKKKMEAVIGKSIVVAMVLFMVVGFLCGCRTTSSQAQVSADEFKAHYLDKGSTMQVEDEFYTDSEDDLTYLEKIEKLSQNLDVESEKNSLLAQELLTMRDARDQLKKDLEEAKTEMIDLNEEIATMQVSITKQENVLDQTMREKKDLLEKLVNLKIEKAKVEKELLKIKIAALSGEG